MFIILIYLHTLKLNKKYIFNVLILSTWQLRYKICNTYIKLHNASTTYKK